MVVRLSVAKASKPGDDRLGYNIYNVAIGHDRIPAVVTQCPTVLSRWLNGVLKASRHSAATTIVGISAAHDNRYHRYHASSVKASPFDLVSLYVGSNCLLFLPPDSYNSNNSGKYLSAFFDNPNVVAVASDARDLSAVLEKHHSIRFRTVLDVNDDVAFNGLKRRVEGDARNSDDEEDDVRGLSLDELADRVFGRDMVLEERSEEAKTIMMYEDPNHNWFGPCHFPLFLADNRVKYSTLDSYLCYLIASEFVDDICGGFCAPAITADKKKKNKNKKNKKKHH